MKNWDDLLGAASSMLLFVTILLLLLNYKEGKFYFLALAFYLLQIMFLNMVSAKILHISPEFQYTFGVWNNLMDLPLMLLFLQYFSKDKKTTKLIWYISGLYILFDLVIYLIMGMTNTSLTIIIGPGLLIVTGFSFYFFVDQLKTAIITHKETGKAFMTGAIVFAYLCFNLIYIMFYLMKSSHTRDIYTIYYITFITFSLCLIIGIVLIMISKRPKAAIKNAELKKGTEKADENSFQFL
jgi:hypothetical protein